MASDRYFIAADYLAHLRALAQDQGVDDRWLEVEIRRVQDGTAPPGFVAAERFLELGATLLERTGDCALPLRFGERLTLETHGFLGYAARASLTVRDALQLDVSFLPVRTNCYRFRLEEATGIACLHIETAFDDTVYAQWLMEVVVASLAVEARQLLARHDFQTIIHMRHDRPDHADAYQRYGHAVVLFGQPTNGLFIPTEVLEAPLVTHDPVLHDLATRQLHEQIRRLPAEDRAMSARVRCWLQSADPASATLEHAAAALAVSPRTLKRRLQCEATSFRTLQNEVRCDEACRLLVTTREPVERVAGMLGYARASNFSRAFRDWTGFTPRAYRRQVLSLRP